ncbi:MAG: glycosyltransferase family 4 protein [Firmicutes bacterium]|nr:glycosyltransferase family 4 protein [Bacillota bacterium]
MKILHFISGGDTGGAKSHVLSLLDSLRKKNINVELLCVMEGIFTEEAREMGIPVTIIPQVKRWDVSVIKKIKQFIMDSGCDLVHCHGARANYIALFIMNSINVPMVTTLHSDYKLDFAGNFKKNLIFTPINAFALRRFKHILTVTNAFRKMLIDRGFKEERLNVIYNGIDFSKDISSLTKAEFLEHFGIEYTENTVFVGIAARFDAVKGVNVFLDGAKLFCEKVLPDADICFLVPGSGEFEEEYNNFVADNGLTKVHLLGQIHDEKLMNGFYNAVDINCLTSFSESFPYALLEGARAGKATVATAVGGIVEMIEDRKDGCLIESGDSSALAAAFKTLYENKPLREQYGKAFYEKAKAHFSVESMAQTHIDIYKKIINER